MFRRPVRPVVPTVLPGAVPHLAGPGAAERAMAAPLLAQLPTPSISSADSLPEVAACLERSALFIGNDFRADAPGSGGGRGDNRPVRPDRCDDLCPAGRRAAATAAATGQMQDLTVAQVLAAATALLAGKHRGRSDALHQKDALAVACLSNSLYASSACSSFQRG